MESIYTMVSGYRFVKDFWMNSYVMSREIDGMNSYSREARKSLINLRLYRSFRTDMDLLIWYSSDDLHAILSVKEKYASILGRYADSVYSSLSIYDQSPYMNGRKSLRDNLNQEPLEYFVAYPMSKSPEWYLLDYDERKEIMMDHIRSAMSNPEQDGIRSYTTYSFGIGDQEFVVLYEVPDLVKWSHVTEKLREARARKWISKETPILIGMYSDPLNFEFLSIH
ncbi:MAG: chlorite dismutase family protein [Thermoplasmata archaeon]